MNDPLAQLVLDATYAPSGSTHPERRAERVAAALRANARLVIEQMGYPERGKEDCPDPWVCCLHPLSEEERARA